MSTELTIRNARIVTRDEEFLGTLHLANGRIADLARGTTATTAEDWNGDYLLPGLVELHTDNLEKHLTPRPGVTWPALPAVLAHDAQIVAAGITTVLDAISIGDVGTGTARTDKLRPMLEALEHCGERGLLRARHLLHLRCELSYARLIELFEGLVGQATLQLVSLMDHTPGQRQFIDLAKHREYYQGKHGLSNHEMDAFVVEQQKNHLSHSAANRSVVVEVCRTRGIPLASHDDATPEHVAEAVAEGVVISEFPTTLLAARTARQSNLGVVMGAPNVVRNGSHSGNVSALELAQERLLDGLSSDYVPASLLHAAFLLTERAGWGLPDAVAVVSANPARLAGLNDRGEIAPGMRADLIRVHADSHVVSVTASWLEGNRIL
ncbi:MAG: alpha-D-ribose 1-methylphosphonate 5-triphosphate diphosphatase [Burkholderiaceae bacterium]|nr:alpha-D-ribose 1-methylphosphonate 5-triphosphate diphosphatase [Sulfuritalea sp.]MCF8173675.1 alpha-D-ribose 1-methylphosphonate 5-triphosphate diphosphatase [Burkholderiaceae bacterium]